MIFYSEVMRLISCSLFNISGVKLDYADVGPTFNSPD